MRISEQTEGKHTSDKHRDDCSGLGWDTDCPDSPVSQTFERVCHVYPIDVCPFHLKKEVCCVCLTSHSSQVKGFRRALVPNLEIWSCCLKVDFRFPWFDQNCVKFGWIPECVFDGLKPVRHWHRALCVYLTTCFRLNIDYKRKDKLTRYLLIHN